MANEAKLEEIEEEVARAQAQEAERQAHRKDGKKDQDEQLYRIRHSVAHVMAQAVLEMFPEGKIAIGPPIEHGFYYDFDLPRSLTPEDLEKIAHAGDHQGQASLCAPRNYP